MYDSRFAEETNLMGQYDQFYQTHSTSGVTSGFDPETAFMNLSATGDGSDMTVGMHSQAPMVAWQAHATPWVPPAPNLQSNQAPEHDRRMTVYRNRAASVATTSISQPNGRDARFSPLSVYDASPPQSIQGAARDLEEGVEGLEANSSGSESSQPQRKKQRQKSSSQASLSVSSVSSKGRQALRRRNKVKAKVFKEEKEGRFYCHYRIPVDGGADGETKKCDVPYFRIPSDLKKHMDKHLKPHKCEEPNCDVGFTTASDLDRHGWSSHHRVPLKGASFWYCSIGNCPFTPDKKNGNKVKVWDRKDNFKQHVKRIHPDEDDSATGGENLDAYVRKARRDVACVEYRIINGQPVVVHDHQRGVHEELRLPTHPPHYQGINPTHRLQRNMCGTPMNTPCQRQRQWATTGSSQRMHTPSVPTPGPDFTYESASSTASSYSYELPSQSSRTSESIGNGMPRHSKERAGVYGQVAEVHLSPQQTINAPRYRQSHMQRRVRTDTAQSMFTGFSDQFEIPYSQARNRSKHLRQPREHYSQSQYSTSSEPARYPTYYEESIQPPVRPTPTPEMHVGRSSTRPDHGRPHATRQNLEAPTGMQTIEVQVRGVRKTSRKPHTCDHLDENGKICNKEFPSKSNLQKHIVRHRKLYACTFEECPTSKRFGSKNDWKRHEDTQHPVGIKTQWRCSICKDMFDSEPAFMSHCHELHNDCKTPDYDRYRIQIKPGGGFWCGFCRKIICIDPETLDAEDNRYAKDERYNHIAKHFHPEEMDIADWTLMKGDRVKGRPPKSALVTVTHATSEPKALPVRTVATSPPAEDDDDDDDEAESEAESEASLPEATSDASGDEEDEIDPAPTGPPHSYTSSQQGFAGAGRYENYASNGVGLHQTLRASSSPPPVHVAPRTREASATQQAWLMCCQCSMTSVNNSIFDDSCMGFGFDSNSNCGHRYCENCPRTG